MIICIDLIEFEDIFNALKESADDEIRNALKGFTEMEIEKIWFIKENDKPTPIAIKLKNEKINYLKMDEYLLRMDTYSTASNSDSREPTAVEKFIDVFEVLTATKGEFLKRNELKKIHRFWN
ncbi:hypothetical protein [Psychroflexus tropicus]|uniref:hypothetical protein n=1 Tax=Psychroflexus tropicus TaxID=197345 RepID=UPI00037038B8|nr:hypothetical protein [Psychroflexus tropicus]